MAEAVEAGQKVVLVSWSGLGRCGALAGCVVLQHGALHDVTAVTRMLRRARNNPRAVESDKQVQLLRAFAEDQQLRQRQHLEHESA
jgi:protein-tyrosine phosphatase